MDIPEIGDLLSDLTVQVPRDLLTNYYFCDEMPIMALVKDAEINTDNHPILEFRRQPTHFDWAEENMKKLIEVRTAYEGYLKQRS